MQTFETIRTRLQTQAAGRFSNINQETKLFIDWMANELNTLHRDLSRSNDAIERRLLQRLQPDVQTRPAPTHTLAYAQPRQNGYVLRPDEDVFTIPRMGQEAPQQIFFSPLLPVPLVKGKVKYLVNDQSLVEIVEYANRQIRTSKSTGAAAHPGVLCVGVQLNTPLLPEQRLCFFLDWKTDNTARKQELYRRLPLVSWYQNEQSLPTETGLWFERKSIERYTPNYVDEEFLHQYSLEQNTLQHYNHCFVTVQASEVQKTALPDELSKQFPPEILEAIGKEEVVWFKLLFPAGFTSEEIRQTTLQLNCFPILNRRLDRTRDFTPAGNSGVEIVALSNADKGRAALSDLGAYFWVSNAFLRGIPIIAPLLLTILEMLRQVITPCSAGAWKPMISGICTLASANCRIYCAAMPPRLCYCRNTRSIRHSPTSNMAQKPSK